MNPNPDLPNSTAYKASPILAISRWSGVSALAAIVTVGLGLSMAAMIAVEFQAQDKYENALLEINPVEDDIIIRGNTTEILPYEKVETPPPPPRIDTGETDRVIVAPHELWGDKNVIDLPPIKMAMVTTIKHDNNYQPILRYPPKMPMRAERSGHCYVRFDVSPEGAPFNVTVDTCSEELFARETIKSVQKWKYRPRLVDGRTVSTKGVTTKISFKLTDENGELIPERG